MGYACSLPTHVFPKYIFLANVSLGRYQINDKYTAKNIRVFWRKLRILSTFHLNRSAFINSKEHLRVSELYPSICYKQQKSMHNWFWQTRKEISKTFLPKNKLKHWSTMGNANKCTMNQKVSWNHDKVWIYTWMKKYHLP